MESSVQQLRAILYAIWRKRWYGLAAVWAVCIVGWLAVALIPNQYKSDARVYVRVNTVLPTQLGINKGGGALQQIDVVRQTLTSRPNLEKVLRRTDMDLTNVEGAELDAMLIALSESISVAPQGSNNLYAISYTAKDPALSDSKRAAFAQRIVQNLIDIFVEDNVASDRDSLNQSIRFLDEQIAARETQLEAAETKKAEFDRQYFDRLPGEGDVASRLSQARAELDRIDNEYIQARSSLGALQAQLSSTPQAMRGAVTGSARFGTGTRYDPVSARGRIEALERQVSDAISRGFTEKHPDIVSARAQMARLQADAAKEPVAGSGDVAAANANPVYVNLRSLVFEKQSQTAALAARRAQLSGTINELRTAQTQQPEIFAQQSKLNRDYSVLRSGYENLLQSRERIRLRSDVASQTDEVQFRTIDPPTLPADPVAPNRPLLLTLVLLGGLVVGLAVAFLASQLHPTYITEEKLAVDTGLPVLGSVAEVVDGEAKARGRKMVVAFAGLGLGLVGIYALMLVVQLVGRGGVA